MKVVIYTLGCKVNQYESEIIGSLLKDKGYEVSFDLEKADIYILNTCAVTNEAERKSRQLIARCIKFNKDAKVYVCGCASENNPSQFQKDNIKYITGVFDKYSIVECFDNFGVNIAKESLIYQQETVKPLIQDTRAYVKIQDGCNNFCSYCLIPYLRGRSRSKALEEVVKECDELAKNYKEIVLIGIDISSYGKDINSSLAALIEKLSHLKVGIRIGSLEVSAISHDLLNATKKLYKFCDHFHLSLQSGDDRILKKMNRHYTTREFYSKVKMIREYYPSAATTTDLICGFPTETDEEFENSINFLKKVKFSSVHVFGYSIREKTKAAKYDQVDKSIIKNRVIIAEDVANILKKEYNQKYIGKEVEVLIEDKKDNYYNGYTRQYVKIYIKEAKKNEIIKVIPTKHYKDGLLV